MTKRIAYILLLLFATFDAAVDAAPDDQNEQIVRQALAALDNGYRSSWAFTRISKKGDNPTTLGRFDPSLPAEQQWTLISLGERVPTAKEQQEWAARRLQGDKDNESGFGNMVTPGSVYLIEDGPAHWLFGFAPAADEDDDKKTRKLMSKVSGQLRVNKAGNYVEEIALTNDEPIKPAMGVKIKVFEMRMTFAPISGDEPVVPLKVDSHIEGRAFMAVEINDIKNVSFSEYQKVVPASAK